MNRIDFRFAQLQSAGRTGLVPVITAGDPSIEAMVPVMHALVAAGADVIELGMPFTDPMADGPAIQKANIRSLDAGTTTADIFALATAFRARHPQVPLPAY